MLIKLFYKQQHIIFYKTKVPVDIDAMRLPKLLHAWNAGLNNRRL